MYKSARKKKELSIEEAAYKLHIANRTLSNYENYQTLPPPEVVLEMNRVYNNPNMTLIYCKRYCPIGKVFNYEILNNVNLSLESVLMSLEQELKEAEEALPRLIKIIRNKTLREDFLEEEWHQVVQALHEFLDLEHNIQCLKVAFNKFTDIEKCISQHNLKCIQRNYVNKKEQY